MATQVPTLNNNTQIIVQPHPHPVNEQLPGIQYCVNSPPPWLESIALAFQHYIVTLGITIIIPSILVPLMGGGNAEKAIAIQTLLFVSGLNTLFQSFFGTRLPVITAGSFSYNIPITSIILARRYNSYKDPHERFVHTMRGIQGAMLAAACFQITVGFFGIWRNVVRFFSPLSVVMIVTFSGLGLYHLGFPLVATCVEIGLPEILLLVFLSQYLSRFAHTKRPLWDRFGILISIPVLWLFAVVLTSSGVYNHKSVSTQLSCRTDRAGLLSEAPWVYIPYPFQYGSPTFNFGEAFAMMAASFVSLFESTGTFYAAARYGSATPIPPSVISRGTGWLGVGCLLSAVVGCVSGTTASVENVGLLAFTKVGSRRVIQISAAFMILFSIFGKFGAFFASIPLPILAATYCVLFGFVSSGGLGFLQFCNLNSFKTIFVLGFGFFIGLSVPQYFREYYHGGLKSHHTSTWFGDVVKIIFMSHATVAALVALFFDCTLSRENEKTQNDCGLKWWERFNLFKSDIRNEEFYGLPLKLNEFFPPL